jgi:hypothetical protein
MQEMPWIKTVFVVGTPTNNYEQAKLEHEQQLYCDILQVDIVDHPYNETLKTMHFIKYVTNLQWVNPPEFIMKTDDDIYLNLPLLSSIIFDT